MPYLLFLKKQENLKLPSAANFIWRFKGQPFACLLFVMPFVVICCLFQKNYFSVKVWIKIRTNILLVLVIRYWSKLFAFLGYQQTTKVAASKERFKAYNNLSKICINFTRNHVQNMKPVQFCTGFILHVCTISPNMTAK